MMALIVLLIVHSPGQELAVFQSSFGPIHELVSKSPAMARERATLVPGLFEYWDKIRGLFKAAPSEKLYGSIRLAISHGKEWLLVDERGTATLNKQRGRFDVVSWERFLEEVSERHGLRRSALIRVEIKNQLQASVKLSTSAGFIVAEVPARSSRSVITWFTEHQLLRGGRKLSTVDRFWKTATCDGKDSGIRVQLSKVGDWSMRDARTVDAIIRIG